MRMLCYDASTVEMKHVIKPARRLRVKREQLRKAMLHDLPVQVLLPISLFYVPLLMPGVEQTASLLYHDG